MSGFLIGAVTDRGLSPKRPINEDRYLAMPEKGLVAVADGVGGELAGEVASQIAVDTILAQLNTAAWRAVGSAGAGEHRYLPQTSHLVFALLLVDKALGDAETLGVQHESRSDGDAGRYRDSAFDFHARPGLSNRGRG